MNLRPCVFFILGLICSQFGWANDTLISPEKLSRVEINGSVYLPKLEDPSNSGSYMQLILQQVAENTDSHHNKICFRFCQSNSDHFDLYLQRYQNRLSSQFDYQDKLDIPISREDVDPNMELNVPFSKDKPFTEIVATLNKLSACQTVTAQAHFMLDEEDLDIRFIFNSIQPLQFLDNPVIHVNRSQHITTIVPKCHFRGQDPTNAVDLRFSKGNAVFEHKLISTEQPYGYWSCDSLGQLHQQQRVTYNVNTPELNQWMQSSGIVSEFGDYSVVIDTPETVGRLIEDYSDVSGKTIKLHPESQEHQMIGNEYYLYAGARGNLYLARKMRSHFIAEGQTFDDRHTLRPTLVKVCNQDDETTSRQGTLYEGSFYKLINSITYNGYTTSSFIQVGDTSGQLVTLTSPETPLSELDVTDALQNLKTPGQPTMDELIQLFQNIPCIFKPYSHTLCVDNSDLPLKTQQDISEHFYLMVSNLEAEIHFCEHGEIKFKTLESSTINPNKWNTVYARLLKVIEREFEFDSRDIVVEEIHADLADDNFFLSLLNCNSVFADKFHVYYSSEIQGNMENFLVSSKLKCNQIIIHADNNHEFMTSRHLRNLGLSLVELKKGIRRNLPAEQNDQRIPTLQFKTFNLDGDTKHVPDDVQDKDEYLANMISMIDPTQLEKISYNKMGQTYPKAVTAFVDMLAKLSQTDSPKLNFLDLNGSKFKDATQTSRVIAAISKFTVLEKFSWIAKGAYQVDNQGLFTCDDFLCSTNQGVVTELLQLVQALSKIPTLRQLGLNMCYLSSIFDGYEIHHHNNKSTSQNNQWKQWLIYGDVVTKPRPTTDHRELIVALLKSMPATMLELHSNIKMDTETIEWLISILRDVCPDCCPGYPNVNNKRSVIISDSKHTVSTMLRVNI